MKGLRSTNHEACGGQSARHVDRSMKSCTRLSRQRGLKNRAAERFRSAGRTRVPMPSCALVPSRHRRGVLAEGPRRGAWRSQLFTKF